MYLPQKWIISEFLKWIISDNQPYDCDEELICPKAKGEHVEDEVNSRAVEGANLMNISYEYLVVISWNTDTSEQHTLVS